MTNSRLLTRSRLNSFYSAFKGASDETRLSRVGALEIPSAICHEENF